MRTISDAALTHVTTTKGVEPIIVVEIQWVSGGPTYRYCDKTYIDDSVEGRILELSNLENVVNISKNSSSQSISIILDDTDGVLKNIYNYSDIHKRPVQVFQWFTGLAYSDRFLIFEGVISSPITWKESDRTLSFDIVSKLEDKEIGYSAEEGAYSVIPDELMGKPWPMPFGTCYKIPTIRLDPIPRGLTLDSDGLADENITSQIAELSRKKLSLFGLAEAYFLEALQAYNTAMSWPEQDEYYQGLGDQLTDKGNEVLLQLWQIDQDVLNLILQKNAQEEYERQGIRVHDGATFPQGSPFSTQIGGVNYEGAMAGDTFNVSNRTKTNANVSPTQEVQTIDYSLTNGSTAIEKLGFTFLQPGLNFKMLGDLPVRYIVAMLPCTVTGVYAKRNYDSNRIFTRVPTNYYTVTTQSYGSVVATIVTLNRPLSYYQGEEWEDEIWVDVVSPVGPNSVAILQWLIQTYTGLGIDEATFAAASAAVSPFPANFCLMSRQNILQALTEVAYLSRCAIWLKNNIFYVRYLPNEPATVDTINESDVIHGSLEINHSPTEDVITKYVGSYVISYDQEKPYKIILRHNVAKYGIQEEEQDWYIYTHPNLVELAMTFWLIRRSNTWKLIKFKTPLHKLKLETFDAVTINFASNYSHNGAVTGIIESTRLDSDSLEIEFEVWLPVRLGEMTQYNFAFPINDVSRIFPSSVDLPGGDGPGTATDGDLQSNNGAAFKGPKVNFVKAGRQRNDHGHTNPGTDNVDTNVLINTDIGPVAPVTEPRFDYQFNTHDVPPLDLSGIIVPKAIPAKVLLGQGEGAYKLTTYPKGMLNETKVSYATLADPTKTLKVGEWVTMLVVVWTIEDENGRKKSKFQNVIVPTSATSVYPGKVISGSGSTYEIALYKQGLDGTPETVPGVRVPQIHAMEAIPPDTWLMVSEGATSEGITEYTMQPPIWLE